MSETQQSTTNLTEDTLFSGQLICRQPRDGYRFSLDAVLVAHFCTPQSGQIVADFGCGCGVIGLIQAHRYRDITVCALEIQPELAALAEENGSMNGFNDRFRVIRGDVRSIDQSIQPESCDLVLCNPPYGKTGCGRLSQSNQAACARHELSGDIEDFVRAAAFAVKNRGRVGFIYPARRCGILLAAFQAHRLTPKRLQPIYSYPGTESARLVLVEAMKNGGEQLEILAPFFIYARRNGRYSPAMAALYEVKQCLPR